MKKAVSLFLALVLCLSLTVPALADGHNLYVDYPNGGHDAIVGDGSGDGWTYQDEVLTLNGAKNLQIEVAPSPTVILAPGSKNVLTGLIGGDLGYTNDFTFKGAGELIIYNPNPDEYAQKMGVFRGLITNVTFQDGLTMTGGAKEGDSSPLSIQPVYRDPVNGYITYGACTADKTPAQYVRIAPAGSAKPQESSKPAPKPVATGFSDVPDTHYAASAIKTCVDKGIVSGYNDGTFKPTAPLTRAQFCVMIARAFFPDDLKRYDTAEYRAKSWFTPAVMALFYYGPYGGILTSVSFTPNEEYPTDSAMGQPISRYDMAHIVAEALLNNGVDISSGQRELPSGIGDRSSIPVLQQGDVAVCYNLGIIGGQSDGNFGGNNSVNRAQACVIIERTGKYLPIKGTSSQSTQTPATPTTPTTPAAPATPTDPSAELVKLLNAERAKAGLKALETMDSLTKSAQIRAKDLSGGYIETRADGSDWTSVLETNNVPADYVDESMVVGRGYSTPAKALEKMLDTPSAKAALMDEDFTHVGVAYNYDANGYQGLQDFWSVMYIVRSGSGSSSGGSSSGGSSSGGSSSGGSSSGGSSNSGSASGSDLQSMRQGVLELVNAARAENGKSPLTLNDSLCDVAQLRADEIVKSFSHTRPNGTSCFTALKEAGISYTTTGENIAAGQSTPASVMDSWMNSSGHRANILNGDFSSIGIGYVKASSGYGHYWVQMFLG